MTVMQETSREQNGEMYHLGEIAEGHDEACIKPLSSITERGGEEERSHNAGHGHLIKKKRHG